VYSGWVHSIILRDQIKGRVQLSDAERQTLAETMKKMREENDNLQQVIKKMKQVDIEIEQRKRDQLR